MISTEQGPGRHRHLLPGHQGRQHRLHVRAGPAGSGHHGTGRGRFEAGPYRCSRTFKAVCEAAGGSLEDIVKLNIFLTDLAHFATVNEVMGRYFQQPYPARAAIGVASLPRGAQVEMDGILVLG